MKKLLCQKAKKKLIIKDVLFQPINRQADRQVYRYKRTSRQVQTDNDSTTKQKKDTQTNKQKNTKTNKHKDKQTKNTKTNKQTNTKTNKQKDTRDVRTN
jgi:hypothetical protein